MALFVKHHFPLKKQNVCSYVYFVVLTGSIGHSVVIVVIVDKHYGQGRDWGGGGGMANNKHFCMA